MSQQDEINGNFWYTRSAWECGGVYSLNFNSSPKEKCYSQQWEYLHIEHFSFFFNKNSNMAIAMKWKDGGGEGLGGKL